MTASPANTGFDPRATQGQPGLVGQAMLSRGAAPGATQAAPNSPAGQPQVLPGGGPRANLFGIDDAIVATAAGAAVNGIFGGGGGQTTAQIPKDLKGPRADQIALLQWLLGLGPQPGTQGQGQGQGPPQVSPGRPTRGFAPGTNQFTDTGLGPTGGPGPFQNGQGGGFTPDFGDPTGRLEQFFGGLGMPTTGLQQQALDAIGNQLRQPAPEQRALDMSLPALQNILGGAPGQNIIDALQPGFERGLASANQTGARFGSANAVLRSRALDDFNLLSANAASQGVNQQINATQALGMLSQAAGQNPFERAQGAFQTGQQHAGQMDVETQRRLQILMHFIDTMQSATLGQPTSTAPNFIQNAGSGALTAAQIYALYNGGGGGTNFGQQRGNTTQSGGK